LFTHSNIYIRTVCNICLCFLQKLKVLFKKKMDSPSRSESSTDSADIRRVEFEDGRVVHLPNRMPEERVMEVRSSQQDLQFYHRYNAGDVCLGPGEDHWEALGRRSEL
jgi:hypothetical protein